MRVNSYIIPTILALLVHAAIVFVLADVWFTSEQQKVVTPRQVQATIVDLKSLPSVKRKEAEARAQAEAKKKREDDARKKAEAEKKRQEKAKREALAKEQARKAAEEKKRKEAERKQAEAKKAKEAAEKKAAEQKAKEAAKKKLAAEKAAKEKAAKEQAAREQAAREKAAQEKAAQEQARREQEAAQQEALRQRLLEQALAQEAAELAAEEQERATLQYTALIRQTIADLWRRPSSARNGMSAEVQILLLPSGEVLDASILRGSGDVYFDRSVLDAVKRAGGFPELQDIDPIVFDKNFRELTLLFRPEDLRY